ncbi:zinc finger SWIM domain-containing protein 8-like [Ptychodera flava]|uniref:zinc finger SWIM domain-containing protein 8-like n=1 Tax=Ptychodera flava TaxID=63121 RepID=UPI003969BEEE
MDFMFDWEDGDQFSFEDSDRFEEDSLCSWLSETESVCNNWRGWKKAGNVPYTPPEECQVMPLVELAAIVVACHVPFEYVERVYPPVPEQLQLRIAFWSFPENEEDIRLYSCLANGSADEFQKGEHLLKARAVRDVLQIGFHLSATVVPPQHLAQPKGAFNVAVMFDRRRITSCSCTCSSAAKWCAHVVALCLFRIHQATAVCLRAPVSESLSRLHRDQLQKFAQYLISELPQQILPTAQRLLDELLSSQESAINTVCGAPDPTAGPSATEQTRWCLDDSTLHENIKKTLIRFSGPAPIVFSDVNSLYLSSTAPPSAAEWASLLRPLRGREPEGVWNLLSIVREMYKRRDSNGISLLKILTEECISCEQIIIWWFNTRTSASHNGHGGHSSRSNNSTSAASQHACASLGDEIVTLWRLAALNPLLGPQECQELWDQLRNWHTSVIERVRKARGSGIRRADIELFSGFKPSIEACLLDWSEYPVEGIQCVTRHPSLRGKVVEVAPCVQNVGTEPQPGLDPSNVKITSEASDNHKVSSQNVVAEKSQETVSFPTQEGHSKPEIKIRSACVSSNDKGEDADSESSDTKPTQGVNTDVKNEGTAGEALDSTKKGGKKKTKTKHCEQSSELDAGSSAAKTESSDIESDPAIDKVPHESAPSSDEYQVYFYDTKAKVAPTNDRSKKRDDPPNFFAGIKKPDNRSDILFAQAEALYAHGYTRQACKLALQLAEQLLSNCPKVTADPATLASLSNKARKKQINTLSMLASNTLAKAVFLCSVLSEEAESYHVAFKVAMLGLEMPRLPASTKALEVKLAHQESELVSLLKKIPLSPAELAVVRERAEQLRDGRLKTRGDALLPIMLTTFIFDALTLPCTSPNASRPPSRSTKERLPSDEKLGFAAAVAALSLKANVSEAEHPLLCEGTRRQRGDLAIMLLLRYKDDQSKLRLILDALLDKTPQQRHKPPGNNQPAPLSKSTNQMTAGKLHNQPESSKASRLLGDGDDSRVASGSQVVPRGDASVAGTADSRADVEKSKNVWQPEDANPELLAMQAAVSPLTSSSNGKTPDDNGETSEHVHNMGAESFENKNDLVTEWQEEAAAAMSDHQPAAWEHHHAGHFWQSKMWFKTSRRSRAAGVAITDASRHPLEHPAMFGRRQALFAWRHTPGPGSDSSSSGNSSDSVSSSSSGEKGPTTRQKIRDLESSGVPVRLGPALAAEMVESRSSTPSPKVNRYRRGRRNEGMSPTVPNQPSEAAAHFYFELAKTVLNKAGGSSSTSLFTQPANSSNQAGPHRALHLCAFEIGLYALGLHNYVSPNWLSRTYSSHVSWITGQAMEIGSAAISLLVESWEGHLTPPEVASLADRASRGRDPNMVRTAAELALSCLPHAHALNPTEVNRALMQCKEQDMEMLERASAAVEKAAKGGGVYPEVLFNVARQWNWLFDQACHKNECSTSNGISVATNSLVTVTASAAVTTHSEPLQGGENVVAGAVGGIPPVYTTAVTYAPMYPEFMPVNTYCPRPGYDQAMPVTVAPPQPSSAGAAVTATAQTMPPAYIPQYAYPPVPQPPTAAAAPPAPNHYAQQVPTCLPIQMPSHFPYAPPLPAPAQAAHIPSQITYAHPSPAQYTLPTPPPPAPPAPPTQNNGSIQVAPTPANQQALYYLHSTFRVGMLAMETLARRVHDERPQTRFARNPPYGDDIKWLLSIAMKLGTSFLQQFCVSAVNVIVSPFILQDIAIESAQYLTQINHAQFSTNLRSPILSPIIQKCLQMYSQCIHSRLFHITPNEYEDFISIVRTARGAFSMVPGGMVQFSELLRTLQRTKSCKKELWQRLWNCLASGSM